MGIRMIDVDSFESLKRIYRRDNFAEPTLVEMNRHTANGFIESGRGNPELLIKKAHPHIRLWAFLTGKKAEDRLVRLFGLKVRIQKKGFSDGSVVLSRTDSE